jgi:hypothetical protein
MHGIILIDNTVNGFVAWPLLRGPRILEHTNVATLTDVHHTAGLACFVQLLLVSC